MKKFSIKSAMLALALALAFVGCKNEPEEPSVFPDNMLGTWKSDSNSTEIFVSNSGADGFPPGVVTFWVNGWGFELESISNDGTYRCVDRANVMTFKAVVGNNGKLTISEFTTNNDGGGLLSNVNGTYTKQ